MSIWRVHARRCYCQSRKSLSAISGRIWSQQPNGVKNRATGSRAKAGAAPFSASRSPSFSSQKCLPPKVNPCAPDLPEIKTIRPAPPAASTVGRVTRWFRRSTNRCGGKHAPGDRLACHLQFSKATDLSGLTVGFEMDDRDRSVPYYQRPKDQQGLCTSFVFYEDYKKIDSRTYEITGLLPACGSARYFLSEVTAFRAGDADLNCPSRNYTSPADIKKPVTFRLENSNQTLLPDLIGVSGDHS